jgi:hypothetical protein
MFNTSRKALTRKKKASKEEASLESVTIPRVKD